MRQEKPGCFGHLNIVQSQQRTSKTVLQFGLITLQKQNHEADRSGDKITKQSRTKINRFLNRPVSSGLPCAFNVSLSSRASSCRSNFVLFVFRCEQDEFEMCLPRTNSTKSATCTASIWTNFHLPERGHGDARHHPVREEERAMSTLCGAAFCLDGSPAIPDFPPQLLKSVQGDNTRVDVELSKHKKRVWIVCAIFQKVRIWTCV